MVADNSRSRCREQGIPFYRFSPKLKDVIAGSETDNEKLFNMVIQTRIETKEQGMQELVRLFHTIAKASHHLAPSIKETKEQDHQWHKQDEQDKQDQQDEEEYDEKKEPNTNLKYQSNHFLLPKAHLAPAMLSDIEESVEQRDASIKRSYKFQVEQSSPSVQTTFLIGEQPGNSEAFQLHHVAAQVAQSTSAQTDSEHKETGDNSKLSFGLQQTALSASAVTTLAGEVADFDVSSDQLVDEKEQENVVNDDREPHAELETTQSHDCLLYTSPSPRDATLSRMPSSA